MAEEDEEYRSFGRRYNFSMNYHGWVKNSNRNDFCQMCKEPMVKESPTQKRCEPCRVIRKEEENAEKREKRRIERV
jgi:hypothetical protein